MIPNLLGCWLSDPFLVRQGDSFIQVLCIASTLSFHVKTTGGNPRSCMLCGGLAAAIWHQEKDTFLWDSSLGQFENNFSPHQPTSNTVTQWAWALVESTRYWRLHGWYERAERQMHFFSAGCWEPTWFSGLRHARAIPQVLLPDFWQLGICCLSRLSVSQWHADWFL